MGECFVGQPQDKEAGHVSETEPLIDSGVVTPPTVSPAGTSPTELSPKSSPERSPAVINKTQGGLLFSKGDAHDIEGDKPKPSGPGESLGHY